MGDLKPLPEIPAMKAAGVNALKAQLYGGMRLPGMAGRQPMDMSGMRRQEAEQLANDMRMAYAFTRQQNKVSKARARAKDRAMQRMAERR